MTHHLLVLACALLLDRLVGDPDWLWRRLPHPVVGFGAVIAWADKSLNDSALSEEVRRRRGVLWLAAAILAVTMAGLALVVLLRLSGLVGFVVEVVIVAIFLAHKSLLDHVRTVAVGLDEGGLDGGRKTVAMIVGRDPNALDEHGVARAAIESLAENFSDGVVAPAFWYAFLGLPGLLAYKLINTADSMIGHLTERHRAFGWASAKLDDVVNWVPARIAALLILSTRPPMLGESIPIVRRDAHLHRSPNAGWPESAMAAVSNLALGGPRVYVGDAVDEPFIHAQGRMDPVASDIRTCMGFADRAFWVGTACLTILLVLS
ncbi:MAG: adenosylcobinamide-phosphate synthase CbiB [Pseudomonadota bacterium]